MARTLHLAGIAHLGKYKAIRAAAGLTLFAALSGCVGQDKYNALKLDRDGLAEQLAKSQSDGQAAQTQAEAYKNQLAQLMANGNSANALTSNLSQQLAALQASYNELNTKYADAMNRPIGAGAALPPALNNELESFAQAHPDMVEFDSARGIVKFKSDVLFDPGETALKPGAMQVISTLASVLNSTAANGYELLVAGHTDNQRVSNPATIRAGNKDNWYLSCHRAISVGDQLMKNGVASNRLGMCGYADQQPRASNDTPEGQRQNRRVEVLILPQQVHGPAVMAKLVEPPHGLTPRKAPPKPSFNKDGGSEMNK